MDEQGSRVKKVLVTGSAGFMGKNLTTALKRRDDVLIHTFGSRSPLAALESALLEVDYVFHLAGVNRPKSDEEFVEGNVNLTGTIVETLERSGNKPLIVFSSSIQAALDNPYGKSKKAAEEVLIDFNRRTGAPVCIYRFPNVFGKWSRPNYNTVVATFCYNIAHDLDISISDPKRELELVYIDDIIKSFLNHLDVEPDPGRHRYDISRSFRITLGELADRIRWMKTVQETLTVPDLSDDLNRYLYSTYLSFLPTDAFARSVKLNTDDRGWLFELIKSRHFGQIFVSKTLPGVTRGNHYHDTKVEKFCVIQGKGIIRFRHLISGDLLEYPVTGDDIRIVDIPPGYTHSIENVGSGEMIVLFWADQIFAPEAPDTFFYKVTE